MPDKYQTRTVLVYALELIHRRGWTVRFSNGPQSPLNIRCAISAACTDLCSQGDWHSQYTDTVACLEAHLKAGVIAWEFGTTGKPSRPRTHAEVESMLTEVIERLENA